MFSHFGRFFPSFEAVGNRSRQPIRQPGTAVSGDTEFNPGTVNAQMSPFGAEIPIATFIPRLRRGLHDDACFAGLQADRWAYFNAYEVKPTESERGREVGRPNSYAACSAEALPPFRRCTYISLFSASPERLSLSGGSEEVAGSGRTSQGAIYLAREAGAVI